MEASGYTTLNRQSGLLREMQTIANNIANTATTGFKQEGIIFSEYVVGTENGSSISMASGRVGNTSFLQGALTRTGGMLDLAIEGDGFFLIESPSGERLTRSGQFSLSAEGDLVTNDGYPVLDLGGAPIFLPPGDGSLLIASDGTISRDGALLGQVGVYQPSDPLQLVREGGVSFNSQSGFEPVNEPNMRQGFLENSNVNPVLQMARMIEVHRAYEMGQSFLDAENQRMRDALRTFVK
ncbi:MAG: flagellar hook-basal body complex protein [Pseudomonadota bacterium]